MKKLKVGKIVTFFGTYEGAIVDEDGKGVAAMFLAGEEGEKLRDLFLVAPEMAAHRS